jgi:hypothetical protein
MLVTGIEPWISPTLEGSPLSTHTHTQELRIANHVV